jgi:hypothetical protein
MPFHSGVEKFFRFTAWAAFHTVFKSFPKVVKELSFYVMPLTSQLYLSPIVSSAAKVVGT